MRGEDEAPARAESLSPLKPQRGRTEFYSYVPYAQWLNGTGFATCNSLVPIQLCGGKKTKWPK